MAKSVKGTVQRRKLLGEIERLAEIAIFGTLSETYRTCGRAGCDCQGVTTVSGLADNRHPWLILNKHSEPCPDNCVVIHDKDFY